MLISMEVVSHHAEKHGGIGPWPGKSLIYNWMDRFPTPRPESQLQTSVTMDRFPTGVGILSSLVGNQAKLVGILSTSVGNQAFEGLPGGVVNLSIL